MADYQLSDIWTKITFDQTFFWLLSHAIILFS